MRMDLRSLLSCALVCLGCSGDEAPSVATPVDFVAQAHQAACGAFFRCAPSGADAVTLRVSLSSADRCTDFRAGASALGWGSLEDLAAAQREGKVRYDGVAALRCIARINTTCDVQHPIGELCPDVFTGTVAVGGSCQRHEECAGGGWCDRGQAMGMPTCPGTCAARKRSGEMCAVNDECAPAAPGQRAECFPDMNSVSRCIPVRTGTPSGVGGSCGHIITPSGGQDLQCMPGLSCVFPEGALAGRCQMPAAVGQPCGDTVACGPGALCVMTTTRQCAALTVQRSAGAPCNAATRVLCDPYARLACRAATCQSIGDGLLNSTCGNMSVPAALQCNAGLYCAGGRCVARKADGQECMTDVECRSDACDRATNTCAARTCR